MPSHTATPRCCSACLKRCRQAAEMEAAAYVTACDAVLALPNIYIRPIFEAAIAARKHTRPRAQGTTVQYLIRDAQNVRRCHKATSIGYVLGGKVIGMCLSRVLCLLGSGVRSVGAAVRADRDRRASGVVWYHRERNI